MRASASFVSSALLLCCSAASFAHGAIVQSDHSTETLLARNIAYRSPSKQVSGEGLSFDVAHVARRVKRNSIARRNNNGGKNGASALDDTWDPTNGPYGQNAYKGGVTWEHGVAAGDPYPTSAILWTKVTAAKAAESDEAICLRYEVSPKSDFSNLVDHNYAWTSSDVDYTIKVEATNLSPKTQYYYRFSTCHDHDAHSPVGKFKTTPTTDDPSVDQVKFAVFSCSNYPWGFFNAYAAAAQSDSVDYALHLGDYIYETRGDGGPKSYGDGRKIDRVPVPNKEILTLTDYRQRHAQYKTDRGSKALLANKAIIAVWDDHEVADNAWKGGTADSNNTEAGTIEGVTFSQRKRNAVRAYFEYMPIRQVDTTDDLRIWRSFQYGRLADIMMLDTRNYERDITDVYYNTAEIAAMSNDTQRSLMGGKQEKWLYDSLKQSNERGATWKLVGQQIIVTPTTYGTPNFENNYDAWDGYNANRDRMLDSIKDNKIDNVIFLAGDTHSAWVNEVVGKEFVNDTQAYDSSTGRGSVAVEFGGTAVSSPPAVGRDLWSYKYNKIAERFVSINRPLQYAETQYRGYFTLTLSQDKASATYYAVPDLKKESPKTFALASFEVKAGQNKLTRPINKGKSPAAGAVQAQTVDYSKNKWNGTAFEGAKGADGGEKSAS